MTATTMPVVRWMRGAVASAAVRREAALYADHQTGAIDQWQLESFNRNWRHISSVVPYWAALKARHALPERFGSWKQVCNSVPLMERRDLQAHAGTMCDPRRAPQAWRATGGSTGQPVRIPIWRSEARLAAADMWHARSWFGISPADKAFLIWGHRHLLGSGVSGFLRGQMRVWKDRLLGYRRWSAYRIGEADLQEAARQLLDFRPAYVLGYAVALDQFARVNANLAPQLRALTLKAVIATAESFPRVDSRAVVEHVCGCPVVMEYGTVETGPIGHELPDGRYRVFWRRYFAEILPSNVVAGSYELAVTSLYPRCLPLIRYRVGDLVTPLSDTPPRPLLEFRSVVGRCNDTVVLAHGRRVHSEAISHALSDASVAGFQLVQRSEADITLRYTSRAALTDTQTAEIRRRLERVDPALNRITFERTANLDQTIAGKTRTVLHE